MGVFAAPAANSSPASDGSTNRQALAILDKWIKGIKIEQIAHFRTASWCNKRGRMLGLVVTGLSIVVGTSIFTGLAGSTNETILVIAGGVSMVAAVFAGAHNFLNYSELSTKHYSAGIKLGSLRKRAEEVRLFQEKNADLQNAMKEIREELGNIQEESPVIPQKFLDNAQKYVDEKEGKK